MQKSLQVFCRPLTEWWILDWRQIFWCALRQMMCGQNRKHLPIKQAKRSKPILLYILHKIYKYAMDFIFFFNSCSIVRDINSIAALINCETTFLLSFIIYELNVDSRLCTSCQFLWDNFFAFIHHSYYRLQNKML